jgi:superfamily I DNA/RNA helicase
MLDRADLSAEQRRAVAAPDDCPLLIDACPGAGKTRVLTYRTAWLIQARGLEPWEVLLLAFTNQAVAEMRGRLGTLLGRRAPLVPVTTLHAFARRLALDFELASGPLTFDQMLDIPLAALGQDQVMRTVLHRTIRHVLVDESQDVNARQAALIRQLIGPPASLTAVGDADQRIFGTLAGALGLDWVPGHFPAVTTLRLTENFRSAAGIVRLANAVMGRDARPRRPAGPPPVIYQARDEADEADFIAREIVRLRLSGAIQAADEVAILVRLRDQARLILRALARRRVPCTSGDTHAPGVRVSTLHASKGGQWPVVLIAGLDEGTLPLRQASSPWAARRAARVIEAQLAEERRLAYVGISRASDRLYLCYPAARRQGDRLVPTRPSRFLAFPPGSVSVRTFRDEDRPSRPG